MENRDLPERLSRAEDVQDLFFSLKLHFIDLHPTVHNHVETVRPVALEKDNLTTFENLSNGYFRYLVKLFIRKTGEENTLGNNFLFFIHFSEKKLSFDIGQRKGAGTGYSQIIIRNTY